MGLYYSQWADRPQISSDLESNHVTQETTDSTPIELSSNRKTTKRPSSSITTGNAPSAKCKKLAEQDYPDKSNQPLIPTAPNQLQIIRALPAPPVSQLATHTVSTTTATPSIQVPDTPSSTQGDHARSLAVTTPNIVAIPSSTQNDQAHSVTTTVATTAATDKVLAVALATENHQACLSVLPNPLMQLALAVITQQSVSLPLRASPSNLSATATPKPTMTTGMDASKPKRKRKEVDLNSTMRPSANPTSARNLYATKWCKENKGGTRGQYATVWDTMKTNKDHRVAEYERRSATIKAAKKSGGNGSAPNSKAPDPENDANEE